MSFKLLLGEFLSVDKLMMKNTKGQLYDRQNKTQTVT